MRRRPLARILIWAVLGISALLLLRRPTQTLAHVSRDESAPPPSDILKPEPSPSTAPTETFARTSKDAPAPHPSLDGTDVNGGFRLDHKGQVQLHRDMRRLFDYYLSLRGRMDPDAIRALLSRHLEARYPRNVINQALMYFDRYTSLLNAEGGLTTDWSSHDLNVPSQVETVLNERRELRRRYLGNDMAEAFYQDQEQYESYQLERMKISTDPQLDESQKKAELEAAESMLSPAQREIRKQTHAWLDIKAMTRKPVDALDAESADAIRQRFGDGALDRLAAVEEERKDWDQKRAAWLAEKARLAARPDLSDEVRKTMLAEYAQTNLNEAEMRRMQALDDDSATHHKP